MDRQVKQAHELQEGDWLMIAGGNYQVAQPPTVGNDGGMKVHLRRHPALFNCMFIDMFPDLVVIVYVDRK